MPKTPSSSNRTQKGDGFPGQRIVVLPRSVVARAEANELIGGLIPTDVGYFPKATGHLRKRVKGVDQAIFIYCTNGRGWCEIAGRLHPVQPGELLVIPREVPHAYGAYASRPWSIHWFHAKGSLLGGFLRELNITIDQPVIRLSEDAQVLALFEEVLGVVEHGYTTPQLLCASHTLAHLLAVLIRQCRCAPHEQASGQQRILQTIAYMKLHLNQPLQLAALATLANLSRSRYVELFKQQSGYAPIDYFIRLRMHRACQLLDLSNLSIKEVAATLGYEDPLYFSRVFRMVNDITPTDYRKLRKG